MTRRFDAMRRFAGFLCACAALLAFELPAGPAAAEVYRCQRADGSVFFSDSKSACPGAREHELRDSVQHVAPAARRPRRSPRASAGPAALERAADRSEAARWRAKKRAKEQELSQLTQQREKLLPFLTHCNKGRSLFTVQENGLKRAVSCKEVRSRLAEAERREGEVRRYLEVTLEEECRRAGCLPGWIR